MLGSTTYLQATSEYLAPSVTAPAALAPVTPRVVPQELLASDREPPETQGRASRHQEGQQRENRRDLAFPGWRWAQAGRSSDR